MKNLFSISILHSPAAQTPPAAHRTPFRQGQPLHGVALGHHRDDAVETFFLSLFYEGRLSCFQPVTYLDRMDITQIRPLPAAQTPPAAHRTPFRQGQPLHGAEHVVLQPGVVPGQPGHQLLHLLPPGGAR